MAIETQTQTIDGYTFSISALPGMRGGRVFTRLMRVLVGAREALSAKDDDKRASAMLGIIEKLSEDDFEYFCRELLAPASVVTPEGKSVPLMPNFDMLFQGRFDLVVRALIFAIQINYGGFLKGLAKGVVAQAAAQALGSPFPNTSATTGPAGDSSSNASPPSKS